MCWFLESGQLDTARRVASEDSVVDTPFKNRC